jgi:hypothetical protein
LSHTSSPLCSGYFGDGISQTIYSGWPQTSMLPISASQVAKITGVSHWRLTSLFYWWQLYVCAHACVPLCSNMCL